MIISPRTTKRTFDRRLKRNNLQVEINKETYKTTLTREYQHIVCTSGLGMSITEPEFVCNLDSTDNVFGIRHIIQKRDLLKDQEDFERRLDASEKRREANNDQAGKEFVEEMMDYFELNGLYEKKTL